MSVNQELLEYAKDKEAELSQASSQREYDAEEKALGYRTEADRDYARVLYSSAFRRLQDKMQLFAPQQNRFHRNRLTHSLEVAQIAKVIAQKLDLNDLVTIQTCALAHDIGNPPFGHYGEQVLNELVKPFANSYEGNAQTYRVLTVLEEKHHKYYGLNLTWRTLFGVVKYPNDKSQNPKKFLYTNDWITVQEKAQELNVSIGNHIRTIDAEIMDIADEIAYAAHDLQDALKQGYFSIDELLYEFSVSLDGKYSDAKILFDAIVLHAKTFAQQANSYQTSEEYQSLFLRELTSEIVNQLVESIDVVNGILGYSDAYHLLAEGLKRLTYNAVSRKRDIKQYELMGEKVLRGLFQVYMDQSYNKDGKLLPVDYVQSYTLEKNQNNFFKSNELSQPVCDYIAGMMDSFAIEQYKKYFGNNSLDNIYFREDQFKFQIHE
jgi:dGTPase